MVFLGLFALFLDKKWTKINDVHRQIEKTVFMKNVSKYLLTYVNKKIKRRKIH